MYALEGDVSRKKAFTKVPSISVSAYSFRGVNEKRGYSAPISFLIIFFWLFKKFHHVWSMYLPLFIKEIFR